MAVSAICPVCGERWPITPTGKKQRDGFSAEWWEIVAHPVKTEQAGSIIVETRCDGSGNKV